MKCLLCQTISTQNFTVEKKPVHSYFHCPHCDLIFMDPLERPLPDEEKARYDLHENEETTGYRNFFAPLLQDIENYSVVLGKPRTQVQILDYGSGPTGFLGKLLKERSFQVANFDIFYSPTPESLETSYDVITSTEVWEHFHDPFKEITMLTGILKTFGILVVMTSAHPGPGPFHDWHYRRDFTHVTFFSEKTMKWIADHFGYELIKSQSPYWVFQKRLQ